MKRLLGTAGLLLALAPAAEAAPRCFGAASLDGCRNPALDTRVFPTPAQALRLPNAPCRPFDLGPPFVCTFGAPRERATRFVAMIGDSYTVHWRAALGPIALLRGWHGSSLTRAACPYSTVPPLLRDTSLIAECLRWRKLIPGWLRRHPEVDTVVVSQHRVRTRGGVEEQVDGYLRAWRALPPSVKRIVVIRATPSSSLATQACVRRAIAQRRNAGADCAMPRRSSLRADPAARAARRNRKDRAVLIDMTRWFCGERSCYPVIGGVLVHKDLSHITATYGRTLAPYLARELDRVGVR